MFVLNPKDAKKKKKEKMLHLEHSVLSLKKTLVYLVLRSLTYSTHSQLYRTWCTLCDIRQTALIYSMSTQLELRKRLFTPGKQEGASAVDWHCHRTRPEHNNMLLWLVFFFELRFLTSPQLCESVPLSLFWEKEQMCHGFMTQQKLAAGLPQNNDTAREIDSL